MHSMPILGQNAFYSLHIFHRLPFLFSFRNSVTKSQGSGTKPDGNFLQVPLIYFFFRSTLSNRTKNIFSGFMREKLKCYCGYCWLWVNACERWSFDSIVDLDNNYYALHY